LNKGSNVHYLLLKALEHAGVPYDQIAVQFLKPADARSAFERDAVDAWAIWDPFLTAAVAATSARTLADGTGLVANREFYLAHAKWAAAHPDLAAILLEELQVADDWAQAKPKEVAEVLAPDVGVAAPILEQIVRRQARGVEHITPAILADQQRIADAFLALGLLPTAVVVTATAPAPH
jgi:sulfonate transport system substrate-binding protein